MTDAARPLSAEPAGRDSAAPSGIVVVDKPAGITSHDVVSRLRRIFGTRRVGHAGTLDPFATGVLVACLGSATRIAEFVAGESKEYVAGVTFGVRTVTQDATGAVASDQDARHLSAADVGRALAGFRGAIQQTPPMVSAVHHQGRRLYEIARQGGEVERRPRPIQVDLLEMETFEPGTHPTAQLRVVCSAGTYIRTLAADLGDALGVGAMAHSLRRTRVGAFGAADALTLEKLAECQADGTLAAVPQPIAQALAHWPRAILGPVDVERVAHGQTVPGCTIEAARGPAPVGGLALLLDTEGDAIGLARPDGGILRPVKVFRGPG